MRLTATATISERTRESLDLNEYSKTALLAKRMTHDGPPLHIALTWAGALHQRSSISTLLCGDWFLGVHAGNFFAKDFVPASVNHRRDADVLGIEPSRVCLVCWHHRRQMIVESEWHCLLECPSTDTARREFESNVSSEAREAIHASNITNEEKLIGLLCSSVQCDWEALGRFAARVRQVRRRMKRKFETMSNSLRQRGYAYKTIAWWNKNGWIC